MLPVLKRISDQRTAVRVEIESAMKRFNTGLLLRDKIVLVGKPEATQMDLKKRDVIRFRIPWDKQFEVQMKIEVGHLNLANGTKAFLCKTPKGRVFPVRRKSDRFYTRRFNNLHLHLPALKAFFQIVDLSSAGCHIVGEPGLISEAFGVKRRLWQGVICVGENLRVSLESVIPRRFANNSVGMEFKVGPSDNHATQFNLLLGTLAMLEIDPKAPIPA